MVVRVGDEQIDRVFHALADATRRDIVMQVLHCGASVSTLARSYTMSFAAVQKHVAVLEVAELVSKERRGREQIVTANIETVRRAAQMLDELEAMWRGRFERIGDLLAQPEEGTPQ
ncbi:MAG: ArsR family transcriptional regulator [Actinomycetota bacterium]